MMKRLTLLKFAIISCIACSIVMAANSQLATRGKKPSGHKEPAWVKKTGARKFPSSKKKFSVNQYGARPDSQTVNTKAIQTAIDACAKAGGGIVVFEPGSYVTGALFIKSNVQLQLDKGVELLGSQHFDDYPEIDTRIAGIEMKWPAALINVIGETNAALTGEGTINARGKFCWDKYWAMRKEYEQKGLRWIVDYDAKRVRTILVQHATDISIKGITVKNAGFWTVQLLYSSYVIVNGVIIRNNEDGKGPSTDGVDVDSSTWVLIEHCDIDCNDDDFCLKAGRDWDGLRVNKPTEYVVIRDCMARKGGGLLTLGSETSGGIRHVYATNLYGKGTGNGLHIKSATTRGGTIEDIHFRNIQMDSVGTAFQFTMNWNPAYSYSKLPGGYTYDSLPAHWKVMLNKVEPAEKGIPHFRDVYISDIKAVGVKKVVNGAGMKESMLQDFHFNNVNVQGNTAGGVDFGEGWKFDNVTIAGSDGKALQVSNSEGMKL
ncbi:MULTISPECIES: glycoside hydrolase family 28 protein [Niastella]|uniref:Glycoside hydrolase family 28 protein n=1 Tax=Niastella soli TaxID=2821487 RepID=A0ABS3Z2W5_9BACT|nr:glycosyl hydrolase family 28 protein [Niastella soli]MBO9204010.1 glycoside hydrolase family 28 protein [Niastella soli]